MMDDIKYLLELHFMQNGFEYRYGAFSVTSLTDTSWKIGIYNNDYGFLASYALPVGSLRNTLKDNFLKLRKSIIISLESKVKTMQSLPKL